MQKTLRVDRIRDDRSQVRLRLRKGSGDAVEPHGLDAHFRRQDGLSRSLDRQLGLPVPVPTNRAVWAEDWSQARVDAKRAHDRRTKDKYYGGGGEKQVAMPPKPGTPAAAPEMLPWWRKLLPW